MTRVNVYVDIEDVWQELSEREKYQFTQASIEEGYGDPKAVFPSDAVALVDTALTGDAVALLAVVTWLRTNGWTVEPA